MDISNFLQNISSGITNSLTPKSISSAEVGGAFSDLANITKNNVDTISASTITNQNLINTVSATTISIISGQTVFQATTDALNSLTTTSATVPVDVTAPADNGFLSSNGVFTASDSWRASRFRPVSQGDVISYHGVRPFGTSTTNVAMLGLNSAGSVVAVLIPGVDNTVSPGIENFNVTISNTGITQISACSRFIAGDEYSVIKSSAASGTFISQNKVQGLSSSLSAITASLSGAVGSISGVTATVNATKAKVDLIATTTNKNYAANPLSGFTTSDGAYTPSANWRSVLQVPVTPGQIITYNGVRPFGPTGNQSAMLGFNISGTTPFIIIDKTTGTTSAGQYSQDVTIPAGTYYVTATSRMLSGDTFSLTGSTSTIVKNVLPDTNPSDIKIFKNYTYNAIGDSITFNDGQPYFGTGTTAIGYQTLIKRQISFAGYNNYGYSGYALSTDTGSTGASSIVLQRTAWTVAGLYTVFVGTNDFKLNRQLGTQNDYINATGNFTFYGALRTLIVNIYFNNPQADVLFMTPLQRSNAAYDSFSTNTAGFKLLDYVNAIRWVCDRESIPVVDFFKESGINFSNLFTYLADGLHPNDLGYAKISKPLVAKLLTIL